MTSIFDKKILAEVRVIHAEQISLYKFQSAKLRGLRGLVGGVVENLRGSRGLCGSIKFWPGSKKWRGWRG